VASISGTDWQAHSEQVNGLLDTHGFAEGSAWFESNPSSDGSGAYTLSKQCVVAYTKRIAERGLAGHFNCNSVSPGPVETPLLQDFHKQEYPGQIDWVIAQTGRAATTQDIAKVMSFLITPEARWINGQDIQVDGGFIAGLEAGWIDGSQSPRRLAARRGQ
ncbi:MAG: SDR family oxidoreductase, partial [Gammaproteobacteria bacterium]|nr:SDR family oxidoreductase [Gammaproteobacteria bacterium]